MTAEATPKHSPVYGALMETIGQMKNEFHTGDTFFLTLKDPNRQKIGAVKKMCEKVANTYFIVREENKTKPGYHFHAIVKQTKKPLKSWFKKGVHTHYTKITPVWLKNQRLFTRAEIYEILKQSDAEPLLQDHEDYLVEQQVPKTLSKQQHMRAVDTVINYMLKELTDPDMWTNYWYLKGNKTQELTFIDSPFHTQNPEAGDED